MISRAGFGDIRSMLELDQMCFPPATAFGRTTLLYYLYLSNSISYLDRDTNSKEVRGFIIAAFDDRFDSVIGDICVGHIVTLDVHPNSRRYGVGSSLLERGIEKLRNRGCAQISLEVATHNEAAITLYQGFGFRIEGLIKDYYYIGPHFEDAYRMVLLMG